MEHFNFPFLVDDGGLGDDVFHLGAGLSLDGVLAAAAPGIELLVLLPGGLGGVGADGGLVGHRDSGPLVLRGDVGGDVDDEHPGHCGGDVDGELPSDLREAVVYIHSNFLVLLVRYVLETVS